MRLAVAEQRPDVALFLAINAFPPHPGNLAYWQRGASWLNVTQPKGSSVAKRWVKPDCSPDEVRYDERGE